VLLREAKIAAARYKITLLLVVIPTKERAYATAFSDLPASIGGLYPRLMGNEQIVIADLEQLCQELGLPFFDVTPALAAGIQSGKRIYPATDDGHPTGAGYAMIADAIRVAVRNHE
jgi:hypothetical protein